MALLAPASSTIWAANPAALDGTPIAWTNALFNKCEIVVRILFINNTDGDGMDDFNTTTGTTEKCIDDRNAINFVQIPTGRAIQGAPASHPHSKTGKHLFTGLGLVGSQG